MIHVVVCGYDFHDTIYKCFKSIEMQTNSNCVIAASDGKDYPERKYLLRNTVDLIRGMGPDPEDIVVCVDADDWLCDETAFQIIEDAYANNPELLLTYGSYVNLSTNKTGKFSAPYLPEESFRNSLWRGSHLKTFKYKLWQKLPDAELRDANGEYFKCCADRAMMIPMMEIAGHDRIKHIPIIMYCYDDTNPNSVWKTMRYLSKSTRDYISSKQPLQRAEVI